MWLLRPLYNNDAQSDDDEDGYIHNHNKSVKDAQAKIVMFLPVFYLSTHNATNIPVHSYTLGLFSFSLSSRTWVYDFQAFVNKILFILQNFYPVAI